MDDSQPDAAQHIDTSIGTCERCKGTGIMLVHAMRNGMDCGVNHHLCTCITDRLRYLEQQVLELAVAMHNQVCQPTPAQPSSTLVGEVWNIGQPMSEEHDTSSGHAEP